MVIYLLISIFLQTVNTISAELFVTIFHSFETGAAKTMSSFKMTKNIFIYEKIHHRNWIIRLIELIKHMCCYQP